MRPTKLLLITIVCAVASVAGVFAVLIGNAPVESPGYAKAVAVIWPILAFVAFGILWPIAVFSYFAIGRFRPTSPDTKPEIDPRLILVIAAMLFGHSVYRIYPVAADKFRERRLLQVATATPVDEQMAIALVDDYMRVSQAGTRSGGFRAKAFGALLRNPTTPQPVIEKIGLGLDGRSDLWQTLGHYPSLPRSVIEARISDPQIGGQLAQNPKLPPEYLRMLAESSDANVRTFVSRNVSTPRESLEKLAQEKDSVIRDFARQNLAGTLGIFAYR